MRYLSLAVSTLLVACSSAPRVAPLGPVTRTELVVLEAYMSDILAAGELEEVLATFERSEPRLREALYDRELEAPARRCFDTADQARVLHTFMTSPNGAERTLHVGPGSVALEAPPPRWYDPDQIYQISSPRDCVRCPVCAQVPTVR